MRLPLQTDCISIFLCNLSVIRESIVMFGFCHLEKCVEVSDLPLIIGNGDVRYRSRALDKSSIARWPVSSRS